MNEIINQQVQLIEADLEILGGENVVLESERDPEFRNGVAAEVEWIREEVEIIGRVFEDVAEAGIV